MAAFMVCRALQHAVKSPSGPVCLLAWQSGLQLLPTFNKINLEQPVRHRRAKHWNPKFKKLRAAKVIKIDLPDFEYERTKDTLTPDEIRAKMKEKGVLPSLQWVERPFNISCTSGVFEPYVPPEGDGKSSAVSLQGAKQSVERIEKKTKSMMAVRKIRNYEEDFNLHEFAEEAREIYISAHEAMANHDKAQLRIHVTEKAYPEFRQNTLYKTMHWKFIASLEPPRVVHARCTDLITKENIFAQVTVRFHTQQTLCIWDRFGRLEYGDENLVKDVLEYVVFEKHVANQYGRWRLHEKIIPDWLPPKEPAPRTFRMDTFEMHQPPETSEPEAKEKSQEVEKVVDMPATATA